MCANAAIEKQKRLNAEIRAGVDDARRGGNQAHGVMQVDNVSAQHVLQHRLAGLKALIEQSNTDEWRDKARNAHIFWQQLQIGKEAPNPGDEEYDMWKAMEEVLQKANEDHAPLECSICMSELTPDEDMFLGKNCYHLYHKSCVLSTARVQAQALGDHSIYQLDRDGLRIWNRDKLGEFPAAAPMPCPTCRDATFCDKQHFAAITAANDEVLAGNTVAFAAASEPDAALEEARRDKYVWLAEVPDKHNLTMVLEARVPANPAKRSDPNGFIGPDPNFSVFALKNRLRDCKPPFLFDFDGSVTGAKCYYREKQPATELPSIDKIPDGAEIAFTKAKKNKETGEEGVPSYKLNLPVSMHPKSLANMLGLDRPSPAKSAKSAKSAHSSFEDSEDNEDVPLSKRVRKDA